MRKPSPAMIVALLGVFLGLGGVGVAATGGNFILGQSNAANNTSALDSGVTTGPTLVLSNSGGKPAARFNTPNGVAPFVVSNTTKVQNLNADKLDGIDSAGFIQGGGNVVSNHFTASDDGVERTLLTLPHLGALKATCALVNGSVKSQVGFLNTSAIDLDEMYELSTYPTFPGYITVYAGTTTEYFEGSSNNRWIAWQLSKRAETSGPVTHITTFEGVAQGGTCFEGAWAVVQS